MYGLQNSCRPTTASAVSSAQGAYGWLPLPCCGALAARSMGCCAAAAELAPAAPAVPGSAQEAGRRFFLSGARGVCVSRSDITNDAHPIDDGMVRGDLDESVSQLKSLEAGRCNTPAQTGGWR